MNNYTIQRRKSSSQYARAKVQQIRKRFGYAQYEKQNIQFKKLKTSAKDNINDNANLGSECFYQKISLYQGNNTAYNEFNNRIKNIQAINQKINKRLKQPDKLGIDGQKQHTVKTIIKKNMSEVTKTLEKDSVQVKVNQFKKKEYQKTKKKTLPGEDMINFWTRSKDKQLKNILTPIPTNQQFVSIPSKMLSQQQTSTRKKPQQKNNKKQQKQQQIKQYFGYKQKKKMYINKQVQTKQIIYLAQYLSKQIQIDQKFICSKYLFYQWDQINKWDLLINKYHFNYNHKITLQSAKKIFNLAAEERNPFFDKVDKIDESCVDQLLTTYKKSLQHWQKQVRQCVSIQQLQKQHFNIRQIDLNKKGYISIQDIVCFVNLYTGNFYKNRDVISLYKKFIHSDNIKGQFLLFQEFFDYVTRK